MPQWPCVKPTGMASTCGNALTITRLTALTQGHWEPCRRALSILERECTPDHPDVANVLTTLGELHEDLSAYSRAEDCYRRAATITEAMSLDQEVPRARRAAAWPAR